MIERITTVVAVALAVSSCGCGSGSSDRPNRDGAGGSAGAAGAGGIGGASGGSGGTDASGGSGGTDASGGSGGTDASGGSGGTGGIGGAAGMAGTGGNGPVETLATGFEQPGEPEVDDTHVYWLNGYDDRSITRVPKAGGTVEVLATGQYPTDIAIDDTNVYFGNVGSGPSVRSVPKTGGTVEVLADGVGNPFGITLDGDQLYASDRDGSAYTMSKTGGTPQLLATGLDSPASIAVDTTDAYIAEVLSISRFPKQGGAVTLLATPGTLGTCGPSEILVDDQWIYFGMSGFTSTGLIRMAKDGSGQEVLVTSPVMDIAFDATHVYFAVYNAIGRADRSTGATEMLAEDEISASGIAVDATHIYWTDVNAGALRRLAK